MIENLKFPGRKSFAWQFPVLIIGWVDGDSFDCFIDLGCREAYHGLARLAHVEVPNKSTIAGYRVWQYVMEILPAGTWVICRSVKMEKFGRPLVEVPLLEGGWLHEHLISKGFGRPYEGGAK